MSSFQINGTDPPQGGVPRQSGYTYYLPRPVASDGRSRPVLNDDDDPWVEIQFSRINTAAWNWYIAFLDSDHKMYGQLTSIRLFNPYDYTSPDGPNWVTYTGDEIYLHKPTYQQINFGHFWGVRIVIKGLT